MKKEKGTTRSMKVLEILESSGEDGSEKSQRISLTLQGSGAPGKSLFFGG